ncbi:MAG TPA: hypothetical protein VGR37_14030 [Longimicrobiaceae bacterium]|nr:hypothetical protein [Longimicrobiaceae bacterium]
MTSPDTRTRSLARFAGTLAVAALAAGCADTSTPVAPDEAASLARGGSKVANADFVAQLSPLNAHATKRAATGRATLTVNGDMVTIMIDARGVFPAVHPQHIHGWMGAAQDATCPSPTADTDGDGLVELLEGLPFYGPVLVPLDSDLSADAPGMFPVAGNDWRYHYSQTISVMELKAQLGISDLSMLDRFAIVLHGAMVDGTYQAVLPIACGEIRMR